MKELVSSVSPKGQVTIPLEIRRLLGVRPKDKVAFYLEGDSVKIVPLRSELAAIYRSVPALDPPRSLEEISRIAWEEHAQHVAQEGL